MINKKNLADPFLYILEKEVLKKFCEEIFLKEDESGHLNYLIDLPYIRNYGGITPETRLEALTLELKFATANKRKWADGGSL